MRKIEIGNRKVGDNEPCYVIAEAGSNHNGALENARKLIGVAAEAGADAVKFQLFKSRKLYVGSAGESDYLKVRKPITEIIRKMELPEEWLDDLSSRCDKLGVDFLCTPFDEQSADLLDKYMKAFKIASYESNHMPLIRHIAKKGKPAIMSTGASTMEEIREGVEAFYSTGNRELALMQCTAKYPAPLSSMNLRTIAAIKKEFGIPVGLSDHSREPAIAPVASVALGANIIEKHFTLSNSMEGPDHKFALEPQELKLMVSAIRDAERALGSGRKEVLPDEDELRKFAKRSIHATRDIDEGEALSEDNIAVLRPGKEKAGLPPSYFEEIIGKKAKRRIRKWEGISEGDF